MRYGRLLRVVRSGCAYEFVDHTGDLGVRVRAPALAALFETAGRALFALLAEGPIEERPAASIRLAAPDRESLLVEWLSELLYLHTVGRWMLGRFRVELEGQTSLRAEVAGEPFDPAHHQVGREVKAATFHGLELEPVDGGWRAAIIFDL